MRIFFAALLICLCFSINSLSFAMGRITKTEVPGLDQAVDFKLEDLNGKSQVLSDYRGKIVFLNFWATWCPPCRAEMPSMQKLFNKADKSKFVMLAVNIGQDIKAVKEFAEENKYTFPILLDREGVIADKYHVSGIPTTFVIDQQGRIMNRVVGSREWSWDEFKGWLK